ncbi:MAG: hypothetical protein CMF49_09940 [Legionellales bacterium]|nr:hypothetical protein [Legionellales bacterium]|tara:strand:- start:344 stop:532 length:189 start_codon:yes stop_codon:yes gene_type:complete
MSKNKKLAQKAESYFQGFFQRHPYSRVELEQKLETAKAVEVEVVEVEVEEALKNQNISTNSP